MLLPMSKVRIIGHRSDLDPTLSCIQTLGSVHLIDVNDDPSVRLPPLAADEAHVRELEELRYLRARLEGLLALAPHPPRTDRQVDLTAADLEALRRSVEADGPEIESTLQLIHELSAERDILPRHIDALRKLLPLVPGLTELEGYETTALLIDARHGEVISSLNAELTGLIGGNFEIISDQVDADTIGAICVFPRRHAEAVQTVLGREQVSRLRLPGRYESVPFRRAVAEMEQRLLEIDGEIAAAEDRIDALVRPHQDWATGRDYLIRRLEQLEATRHLGATTHTFVLSGWVPTDRLDDLRAGLEHEVGETVVIDEIVPEPDERPPVLMRNRPSARPFEYLVRLLSLPRYGSLDPTGWMSLFLPLFFGMMLGDIVYGVVLLGISVAIRRVAAGRPVVADLGRILTAASVWTIVWGVVYGEFLGNLGHLWFGLEPIWINREEALEPLLVFALAIGAAHVTLGLLLGLWSAFRARQTHVGLERAAMLLALIGLFMIAGVASERLPGGAVTPAVAAVVVGLVTLMVLGGAMGPLLGPLELLGTIGNVLSYLRIAAIGLASVYLARVANELGATAPLWLGLIVASLFHALNLALGTFSPAIQSLRLHYVEFFGKFYDEGGLPFEPFGGTTRPTDQTDGAEARPQHQDA